MNIFITGTAGYIGGMLADQYSQRDDVDKIVCLDKDPMPQWLQGNSKLHWVRANLTTDDWQQQVVDAGPVDAVIHCAWQIRDFYGQRQMVHDWNYDGSQSVFDFAFSCASISRLVYFSSIAQFGASRSNRRDVLFGPDSPTTLSGYAYADDKYEVDILLEQMYAQYRTNTGRDMPVTVIKPSTVTGPRGRVGVGKFSLASALSSDSNKSAVPLVIRWMLFFMPIVGRWTRQFVHEDDICDVVSIAVFDDVPLGVTNYIVSPNDIITGREMARIMGKYGIHIPGWAAATVFFIAWHLSRGRVPTGPDVWKFFAYPICVDGSRVTDTLGYHYRYTSIQAISTLSGRYNPTVVQ